MVVRGSWLSIAVYKRCAEMQEFRWGNAQKSIAVHVTVLACGRWTTKQSKQGKQVELSWM